MELRTMRPKPAHRIPTNVDMDKVRTDGPGRADQDQERDRSNADLQAILPRGYLRQSCAMNIDGSNTLACTQGASTRLTASPRCRIYPLPHMAGSQGSGSGFDPLLRAATHRSSHGCEVRDAHRLPDSLSACSPKQDRAASSMACMSAFSARVCCTTSCPELLVERRALPGTGGAVAGPSLDRLIQPRRSTPASRLDDARGLRSSSTAAIRS